MTVPSKVPPPAALIVAALPTCQNTFLACAPLARMMLEGAAAPGPPTVSVVAIWKTQTALALPCASSVRLPPWIMKLPAAAVYTPGASVLFARLPAPGSGPPGIATSALYAASASARACDAIENVVAVPSLGQATVGGGAAV